MELANIPQHDFKDYIVADLMLFGATSNACIIFASAAP